jgi:hypothetical protein
MSSLQVFPTLNSVTRLAAGFLLCVASAVALADDGHGHGDAAPAAASTASPRIAAHSELFELVGIVDKGQMKVYLDRYATNEPVTGARIEYESGNNKGTAQPQPDGTYLVKFDALGKPGDLPFSFTVSAGPDTDLLAVGAVVGRRGCGARCTRHCYVRLAQTVNDCCRTPEKLNSS